ncbi:DUF502 domain-containing protein [Cocleimonas flava]|jgi:uncharacterized membrane protein|uniref:Putative membrane protein n=1 Tax=Cocleimonas flava TaxID=634765 RepID=A0A4R1F804_9GAMM|nr:MULTISPECIES: DUF502 domain-containing protein [Cocleimonas]MEB8432305.1 DUF502 domain-containing protein [Cocleimonas sp. KMM 6892]MEC4714609.1 DUF502 domain-containing protein [Cocleimonas sp. KMM 6895]MEC4744577.1 DUF502 domain-containing protein [Cocleimonas sp. KMM 6896]TCJ86831.1 putative membrane protein [Cocleimonas flava]
MLGKLRKYIITGLLIWIPLGITIFVIKLLVNLMDNTIVLLPPAWRPEALFGFNVPGLGIVISAMIIFITGFFLTNLAGKRIIHFWENLLDRIPLVRSIYSSVKQVTSTILSSDSNTFNEVLLIQYPRLGVWTICFKTNDSPKIFSDATGQDLITVFVPTTPNPTSGFILLVPKDEVKKMDMDVEDALKLVMSLGVVTPERNAKITTQRSE